MLDSGILCCLIHILNALLKSDELKQTKSMVGHDELVSMGMLKDKDAMQVRRLEVLTFYEFCNLKSHYMLFAILFGRMKSVDKAKLFLHIKLSEAVWVLLYIIRFSLTFVVAFCLFKISYATVRCSNFLSSDQVEVIIPCAIYLTCLWDLHSQNVILLLGFYI